MSRGSLRHLADIWVIIVCLTFVFLAWYAHLALKRGSVFGVVMASLLFSSGATVGAVSLTIPRTHQGRYPLDPRHLTKGQNCVMAIVVMSWAVCSLWVAVSEEMGAFLQKTFGERSLYFLKATLVVGFFAFLYAGVRYLLEARRRG